MGQLSYSVWIIKPTSKRTRTSYKGSHPIPRRQTVLYFDQARQCKPCVLICLKTCISTLLLPVSVNARRRTDVALTLQTVIDVYHGYLSLSLYLSANITLTLGNRMRHWPIIKAALAPHLAFAAACYL